jgi:phytoene dehydrogenase-like protein
MARNHYDVIVVGAGVAGLSCAAELVLAGKRPLLISETEEVAATVRSTPVGDCSAIVQQMWIGWARHMLSLSQRLNLPVKLWPGLGFGVRVQGRDMVRIPYCPGASAFGEVIESAFGFPSPGVRADFERALQAGVSIPREELMTMHRVPVAEWLAEQGTGPEAAGMLMWAFGTLGGLSPAEVAEHESVFGAFANYSLLSGEAIVVIAEPGLREGWAIPVAEAVAARGGEVWKGSRVDRVLVENDRAIGVVMADGREARADNVAIAVSDARIPKILDAVPDSVQAAIDYSSGFDHQEFDVFTVLGKPVVPDEVSRWYSGYMSQAGDPLVWTWPLHAAAPWTTAPGKQLLVSERLFSSKAEVEAAGGQAGIEADIHRYNEELFPGYTDAMEETVTIRHRQLWMVPLAIGPKMPRKADGIAGLWFVSNSSTPLTEVYLEGAACAGILGAREMLARD